MSISPEADDQGLVAASVAGNRDAFAEIVRRYQSLVCSVAYSATGSLTLSEDLAQDTFLKAWQDLKRLREPHKLRSWLCSITRHTVVDAQRRQRREPLRLAEPLDDAVETPSLQAPMTEHVIQREEEAILWRSLEGIAELYREPLILYYRQGHSVADVAAALELSEDTVKQRLSRGRKMLAEEVSAFVEGALERTNPGKAFTLGVLAALPLAATSAKAAAVGGAAVKSGAAAKSAGLLGAANAVFGPLLVLLGTYFGYRLEHESAQSPRRRECIKKYYRILVADMFAFVAAVLLLVFLGRPLLRSNPGIYVCLLAGLGVAYLVSAVLLTFWMRRASRLLDQNETAEGRPIPATVPLFEYRSKAALLGLPLLHIRLRGGLERGPVKAWFAAGDWAIGVIFAFGAIAVAPISFGGFAFGLVTLGGFALGIVSFGGIGVGAWAVGGLAVGMQAYGACALGWLASQGAAAAARDFATGAVALARNANNPAAELFMQNSSFFRTTQAALRYATWLNLLWLFPLALWLWQRKKNKGLS